MITYKKVNIKQAQIVGEALYHLPESATRARALKALYELTEMAEGTQGRLKELRRIYYDLKIHTNDTGTVKILDQVNSPFWWALFESELQALEAFHCYYQETHP